MGHEHASMIVAFMLHSPAGLAAGFAAGAAEARDEMPTSRSADKNRRFMTSSKRGVAADHARGRFPHGRHVTTGRTREPRESWLAGRVGRRGGEARR